MTLWPLLSLLVIGIIGWSWRADRKASRAEIDTLKSSVLHLYQSRDDLAVALGLLGAEEEIASRTGLATAGELQAMEVRFLLNAYATVAAGWTLARTRSRQLRNNPLLGVGLSEDGAQLAGVLLRAMAPHLATGGPSEDDVHAQLAKERFNRLYASANAAA